MYSGWTPKKLEFSVLADKERFNMLVYIIKGLTGYKYTDIVGKSRKENYVRWRMVLSYSLRIYYGWSYKMIGALLSNRDHSTIIHHCKTVADAVHLPRSNKPLYNALNEFKNEISK